jgi:NAD(P)-dependent dehydrogenase (short-subunit alcohol dehydrogenase family)
LLTAELLPLLRAEAEASGDARIVNHSSGGRNLNIDPLKGLEERYLGKNGGNLGGDAMGTFKGPRFERYCQSKLANAVFTYGLHAKLAAKGEKLRAIAAHPGVSDTNLGDDLNFGFLTNLFLPIFSRFAMQNSQDGAMGLLMGMMDPSVESGTLYGPKDNAMKGAAVINPPLAYENDPKAVELLWKMSEEATGVKLDI